MNPGKIVDPYPLDSNLRTGPDYKPLAMPTIFQFPDDHGSMAQATERCFGVGKCRKVEGETMCPSFQVTRDERHSTCGRTRVLFEMLRGETIPKGWKDEGIKEALDLCVACKGCKGDCPVSVDVATYKAEFLAHYYEGNARPAAAYSMGLIDKWAALGSRVPMLANMTMATPGVNSIIKQRGALTPYSVCRATELTEWLKPCGCRRIKSGSFMCDRKRRQLSWPAPMRSSLADLEYALRPPARRHSSIERPL